VSDKAGDAGPLRLALLNQNKRLKIRNCPQLTPAGIAAFESARPDVTLVR
jgi:hypothetical protein